MSSNPSTHSAVSVVALCGSLRRGSYTRLALEVALRGAASVGAGTRLIDLNDFDLPLCDGVKDDDILPPSVFELRRILSDASGILIGTPEYHGSFSGVLKNAIDLMSFSEFEGKVLGLVGVSGGAMGAMAALNSLRVVGRALHAWVVPEQVAIPTAWKVFDADGKIGDSGLEKRLLQVGSQVARFAALHTSDEALQFLREWEGAPVNPGGED